ncbi:MAG: cupin domain-containing protein [Pyrinomonadaceae bacterium]
MKTSYTRLFADEAGESHFEEIGVELPSVDFAPPAPLVNLSSFLPATQLAFFGAPGNWQGDWHPSSGRNFFVLVSGEWEIEASDGTVKRFVAKDVLLAEDTHGKGHKSHVSSATESLAIVVQLES